MKRIPADVIIPYGITVIGHEGIKHDIQDKLNKNTFFDLIADQEEMKKDESSTPLTITPNPPWEQ
ncbi:hypothetical protein [Legionella parisiensis]|uniref:hypothetical protein n=1 Tax=Legionella parisiensis TaxID=45071 RepID=UPI0007316B42|nr:hypothetical protein [Legionella parisiensis]